MGLPAEANQGDSITQRARAELRVRRQVASSRISGVRLGGPAVPGDSKAFETSPHSCTLAWGLKARCGYNITASQTVGRSWSRHTCFLR
jgi:hypothetical protein